MDSLDNFVTGDISFRYCNLFYVFTWVLFIYIILGITKMLCNLKSLRRMDQMYDQFFQIFVLGLCYIQARLLYNMCKKIL